MLHRKKNDTFQEVTSAHFFQEQKLEPAGNWLLLLRNKEGNHNDLVLVYFGFKKTALFKLTD